MCAHIVLCDKQTYQVLKEKGKAKQGNVTRVFLRKGKDEGFSISPWLLGALSVAILELKTPSKETADDKMLHGWQLWELPCSLCSHQIPHSP